MDFYSRLKESNRGPLEDDTELSEENYSKIANIIEERRIRSCRDFQLKLVGNPNV
jgi:hypothetical protein